MRTEEEIAEEIIKLQKERFDAEMVAYRLSHKLELLYRERHEAKCARILADTQTKE